MTKKVGQILDAVVEGLGGSRREGQATMAERVTEALESDGHLLVQAGTGTGKSIGYLAPAMYWAVTSDHPVIISTATLALQRQILLQDSPRVAKAVTATTGKTPKVALLKGWNNYVCLRKATGGYPEEDALISRAVGEYGATATGEEVTRLREWAMSTDTGDRDDLVPGVSDRAWRQVSLSKPECIGNKCPLRDSCFPLLARGVAEDADVVITNHSMLGIQSAGTPVLPEAGAYVVDEAHDLVDRVTSQLTSSISAPEVAGLARLLRREKILATDLEAAGQAVGDALDGMSDGRVTTMPNALADALLTLLGELQQANSDVADLPGKDESDAAAKSVARGRVQGLADVVERLLSDERSNGKLVTWVQRDMDDRPSLHVAPLDVSTSLADHLFEAKPAVLTSATLELGGSFQHVATEVGFTYPSQGPWDGVDVGSPFDYTKQGILYVAEHLPTPGRDGYGEEQLREITELIEASGGGALCLFTSRRGAERAAEYVREHGQTPVLVQGEDQLPTLVREFSENDEVSLFGTLSLWQGVDVPGRTCRLVIIDRIPFPRPDEPLSQARTQAVSASGGNGFMQVAAAHAALLLAQGAGRLVRRTDDKGVVAILDPRLRTARYAGFLLSSLPPMWRTTDATVVREVLARLR
ncbi:MAG: ATP-dependent DNA helicase [Ancrocorticia sp.]|uniref:ATP-dependent DNA helicase n=1 Tax=Ancrocorticia sp. TaxID=2593684 RepID=UPI003F8F29EB